MLQHKKPSPDKRKTAAEEFSFLSGNFLFNTQNMDFLLL